MVSAQGNLSAGCAAFCDVQPGFSGSAGCPKRESRLFEGLSRGDVKRIRAQQVEIHSDCEKLVQLVVP